MPLASLYSHNIKIIDDDAPRIAFIRDPVELSLENIDDDIIELPTHPNNPELGSRIINIKDRKDVERTDLQDNKLRLKNLEILTLMVLLQRNFKRELTRERLFIGYQKIVHIMHE